MEKLMEEKKNACHKRCPRLHSSFIEPMGLLNLNI